MRRRPANAMCVPCMLSCARSVRAYVHRLLTKGIDYKRNDCERKAMPLRDRLRGCTISSAPSLGDSLVLD